MVCLVGTYRHKGVCVLTAVTVPQYCCLEKCFLNLTAAEITSCPGKPDAIPGGKWDDSCFAGASVGVHCSAKCDICGSAQVTCYSDGTWTIPNGRCTGAVL